MTNIIISDEAVQDLQALFSGMEFIVNSIRANGGTKLSLTKEVFENADRTLRQSFTLITHNLRLFE